MPTNDPPVLHHVILRSADIDRAAAFYEAALDPLGIVRKRTVAGADGKALRIGFGSASGDHSVFWLAGSTGAPSSVHLAFSAGEALAVDHFHEQALAWGGQDNGVPGLRPIYHPCYYAAFVLDPDGNNIEAVYLPGK